MIERTKEMFGKMNKSEKHGCQFGLFPVWVLQDYSPTKEEEVELIKLSEKAVIK